jgi:hypothetical protein
MKPLVLIACAALATVASIASAAEPPGTGPRERAMTLYFSKSFGSTQRQNRMPLAFGLRLEQSAPFDLSRSIGLFDARYSLGGRKEFLMGGFKAFGSSDDSSGGSSGESGGSSGTMSQTHPAWTTVIVVLGVLGILCATETGICEGNKRDPDYTPPGPTGPG